MGLDASVVFKASSLLFKDPDHAKDVVIGRSSTVAGTAGALIVQAQDAMGGGRGGDLHLKSGLSSGGDLPGLISTRATRLQIRPPGLGHPSELSLALDPRGMQEFSIQVLLPCMGVLPCAYQAQTSMQMKPQVIYISN